MPIGEEKTPDQKQNVVMDEIAVHDGTEWIHPCEDCDTTLSRMRSGKGDPACFLIS